MQNSHKISSLQLFILLLLARVMHTMIYYHGDEGVGLWMMPPVLAVTAIEAVIAIPVVKLANSGESVTSALGSRLGKAAAICYSAFFIYILSGTMSYFAEFMHSEFWRVGAPAVVILILCAAAGYCAYLGIEPVARAASVVAVAFFTLFIAMALVSEAGFDSLNFEPLRNSVAPNMLNMFVQDLSSSWWLPMLAALSPHLGGYAVKTAASYLISKLLLIELLMFLLIGTLGDFVRVIGYPILALGAYARTDFIRHFDAVNMFVWSLNCVIVGAVYLFIASRGISPKTKPGRIASVVVVSAVAAAGGITSYYLNIDYRSDTAYIIKLLGIVVLGVILPAVCLLAKRFRLKKEESRCECSRRYEC